MDDDTSEHIPHSHLHNRQQDQAAHRPQSQLRNNMHSGDPSVLFIYVSGEFGLIRASKQGV